MSKKYAQGMIAYAMGGRAAEEIVFDHFTTGASNDLQKATDIARKMVCQWGMSDVLRTYISRNCSARGLPWKRSWSQRYVLREDAFRHRFGST